MRGGHSARSEPCATASPVHCMNPCRCINTVFRNLTLVRMGDGQIHHIFHKFTGGQAVKSTVQESPPKFFLSRGWPLLTGLEMGRVKLNLANPKDAWLPEAAKSCK
ncbi:hypothetical protein ACJJTC_009314 [Scirpophaga incertulas]